MGSPFVESIHAPDDLDGSEGLLALVIRNQPYRKSAEFFTDATNPLQVGLLHYKPNQHVAAHKHLPHTRTFNQTQEVLFVREGCISVTVFTYSGVQVRTVTLKRGDCILLMGGAHSLYSYVDSDIIECKLGPYVSRADDKVDILPSGK